MIPVESVERIAVVGTGKVAETFLRLFHQAGIAITGIYGRNEKRGEELAKRFNTSFCKQLNTVDADLIFIAVADDAVENVVSQVSKNHLFVHTSGSVPLRESWQDNGAVFYPLQSFTESRELSPSAIPILLEVENQKFKLALEKLCARMDLKFAFYNSEERKKIHLSAVFLNNFVNHLVYKSEEIAVLNKIDFSLLRPLMEETFSKLKELTAFDAQTGPARRGDKNTIQNHLTQLNGINHELYDLLSQSILKTYKND